MKRAPVQISQNAVVIGLALLILSTFKQNVAICAFGDVCGKETGLSVGKKYFLDRELNISSLPLSLMEKFSLV